MIELRPFNVNVDVYVPDTDVIDFDTLVKKLKDYFEVNVDVDQYDNRAECTFSVSVDDRIEQVCDPIKKILRNMRIGDEDIEIEIY